MICFLGTSHAARHLKEAAILKGAKVCEDPGDANVIFVSEDTQTDEYGNRDLTKVRGLISIATTFNVPIVLTSQVPPGFTRSLGIKDIFHQAETLRIKDAEYRSMHPDYLIVGCDDPKQHTVLPDDYWNYLQSFHAPLVWGTYEDAEFSKIAVNMFLAAQVDATNRLSAAAAKCGATWEIVADVLALDQRIGPNAYLTPGRWQDSAHLMRDAVTLKEIENFRPLEEECP